MSINENDLLDLDPTDADLFAEVDEDEEPTAPAEDDDLDFDSNYEDDRYASDGIPSWSAWA